MPRAKLLWECFLKEIVDGVQWAVCNLCGTRLKIIQCSTSSMRYHLRSQHPIKAAELQQLETTARLQIKEELSGFGVAENADYIYEGESSSGYQMDPLPIERCEQQKPQTQTGYRRPKATLLWECFHKQNVNGQTWAICKMCDTRLKIINSSTTNVRYHLRSKHPKRAAKLHKQEMMAKSKLEEEQAALNVIIQSEDYVYEADPSAYQNFSMPVEDMVMESGTSQFESKCGRKKALLLWDCFKKRTYDGQTWAVCKECGTKLKITQSSTSTMRYHLRSKHPNKASELQKQEALAKRRLLDERSGLEEVEDEDDMFEADQSGSELSTSLPKRRRLVDPSDTPYINDYYEKWSDQDQEQVYYKMEDAEQFNQKIYHSLSKLDSDVRIHCSEGKVIQANRQILSLGSMLFRSIFTQDCSCTSHFPSEYDIFCPDIGSEILGKVLGSFETGKSLIDSLTEEDMEEVQWIIDNFQIIIPFEFVVSEVVGKTTEKSTHQKSFHQKESHRRSNIKIENTDCVYIEDDIIELDDNIDDDKIEHVEEQQNTIGENAKKQTVESKNVKEQNIESEKTKEHDVEIEEDFEECNILSDKEKISKRENVTEQNIEIKTVKELNTECELAKDGEEENIKNKKLIDTNIKKINNGQTEANVESEKIQLDIEEEDFLSTCLLCNEDFASFKAFQSHKRNHSSKLKLASEQVGAEFACVHCNEKLASVESLNNHTEKNHLGTHKCYRCNKNFERQIQLQIHITDEHKESEVYKCHLCSKQFAPYSRLKDHSVELHPEINELFECLQCNSTFGSVVAVKHHSATNHQAGDSCDCKCCGVTVTSTVYLKTHLLSVHRWTRPYLCEICHRVFDRDEDLQNHVSQDHKSKMKCCVCQNVFQEMLKLQKYMCHQHESEPKKDEENICEGN